MREIAISKFKATCLAELETVRRTRKPLRITRFGKPVAEIIPPADKPTHRLLGGLADTGEILGDLVSPIGAFGNWKPEKL